MEFLVIGVAVALNLLIVIWKFQAGQLLNGLIDGALLVLVAIVFSTSTAALIIGTIGSLIVSLYLSAKPIVKAS